MLVVAGKGLNLYQKTNLDSTKLKAFADDKLDLTQMKIFKFVFDI